MERQLLFEVGRHLFAVDAAEVREVVEPLPATPIPGAMPAVLGLVNLRGTLVIVAEPATLLDLDVEEAAENPAFVVLDVDARRLAVRVDRAVGVAAYPESGLDVEGELLEALGGRDLVMGVGEFGSRPYYRLDAGATVTRVLGEAESRTGTDR